MHHFGDPRSHVMLLILTVFLGMVPVGCSSTKGSIEGTWKTSLNGQDERDVVWLEFNSDRTGEFYGTAERPRSFVWTRIDGMDQLERFIAKTGVSLRQSVREGTPLPYSEDGNFLALINATTSKGFPLMRILSLDRKTMVVEFESEGAERSVSMERVD